MNNLFRTVLFLLVTLGIGGCTKKPEGVEPVRDFDIKRYLGTWYEIARLDHSFERGATHVHADYTPRPDGGVRVVNKGFYPQKNRWKEAVGRAYPIGDPTVGHLKVSFFGPFYGSYIVFELDPDYQYAFVAGYSKKYLWLLARTPFVSDELKQRFVEKAKALGFPVDTLIWCDQRAPRSSETPQS